MPPDRTRSDNARAALRLPTGRWVSLGVLLLAEWTLLSLRFDPPDPGPHWWGFLLERASRIIMPLGIAIGTAIVLLWGRGLRAQLERVWIELATPRRAWPFVTAHVLAFILFFRLTAIVLEGHSGPAGVAAPWGAAWVAAALATGLLWVAALLPAKALVLLARHAPGTLLAAAAVGVAALAAGKITDRGWYPLGHLTLRAVTALVGLMAGDSVSEPARFIVGTKRFSVTIAHQCSGYQGIGLIWVFLGTYLWLFRSAFRFPRALLLLPLGTVLVWLANAARIVALIMIGTWVSPAIAFGGFHSYSGWLLFCAVALALAAVARRARFFAAVAPLPEHRDNPTAAYLAPLAAGIAASMLTGAFSAGGPDALYPLRVVAAGGALWLFRREYRGIRWTASWTAVAAGAVVFALWIALEPSRPDAAAAPAVPALLVGVPAGVTAAWFAFRVLGSVVTVPLAEELAFRGYLTRRLIAADFETVPFGRFSWLSFLGSSILFGAMHNRLLAGTLAGAVYTLVLYRRSELTDPIVAHATTNAMLAAYVLATGTWSLWA
jgi:exosortase E/protease (VPEID-CTERM system)